MPQHRRRLRTGYLSGRLIHQPPAARGQQRPRQQALGIGRAGGHVGRVVQVGAGVKGLERRHPHLRAGVTHPVHGGGRGHIANVMPGPRAAAGTNPRPPSRGSSARRTRLPVAARPRGPACTRPTANRPAGSRPSARVTRGSRCVRRPPDRGTAGAARRCGRRGRSACWGRRGRSPARRRRDPGCGGRRWRSAGCPFSACARRPIAPGSSRQSGFMISTSGARAAASP